MMLQSVDWSNQVPVIRGGPYTQLTIRIEMDDQSREMYRTWSTGWRSSDNTTPIPQPKIEIHIVTSEDFISGIL